MDRPKEMAEVADNATGLNNQYSDRPYGLGGDYASTGLGGSQGDMASQTEGPLVGSPVVSAPFGSSQLPVNTPRLPVLAGDTSAMSSDQAVGDNFTTISGAAQDSMTATGAGTGHVGGPRHPNASAPGPEV
jgi:hypothetical protein